MCRSDIIIISDVTNNNFYIFPVASPSFFALRVKGPLTQKLQKKTLRKRRYLTALVVEEHSKSTC